MTTAARPSRPVGHGPISGGLRFAAELVAWVAVPWALWPHSPLLAIAAVLVLVVPPAVLGTEQPRWRALVEYGGGGTDDRLTRR